MTRRILWAAALAAMTAGGAFAADSAPASKTSPDVQKKIEMHEKMAKLHQEAADCLRSGKAEKDCHAQVMKDCPMKGSDECPFMGGKGHHHHHGMKGMQDQPKPGQTAPSESPK